MNRCWSSIVCHVPNLLSFYEHQASNNHGCLFVPGLIHLPGCHVPSISLSCLLTRSVHRDGVRRGPLASLKRAGFFFADHGGAARCTRFVGANWCIDAWCLPIVDGWWLEQKNHLNKQVICVFLSSVPKIIMYGVHFFNVTRWAKTARSHSHAPHSLPVACRCKLSFF
jgi:hypothetical protein